MNHIRLSVSILTFCVIILSLLGVVTSQLSNNNTTTIRNSISQNFAQVIDAATAAYIATPRWIQALNSYGVPFNVPTCIDPPSFPATFNFTQDSIKMCVEMETNHPWEEVHELAAQLLIEQINNQYKRTLKYEIIKLNTTVKGYFPTMRESVDSGPCLVAITSTNYDSNRAQQVKFQCMYGQSSFGFLRTGLESDRFTILDYKQINQTGVKLATYGNTIYDNYATKNFNAATIVRINAGWYEVFKMAERKEVHIILAEATDIRNWLSKNSQNCNNCSYKLFGDPFSYSSFVTKNIISGVESSLRISSSIELFIAMVIGLSLALLL